MVDDLDEEPLGPVDVQRAGAVAVRARARGERRRPSRRARPPRRRRPPRGRRGCRRDRASPAPAAPARGAARRCRRGGRGRRSSGVRPPLDAVAEHLDEEALRGGEIADRQRDVPQAQRGRRPVHGARLTLGPLRRTAPCRRELVAQPPGLGAQPLRLACGPPRVLAEPAQLRLGALARAARGVGVEPRLVGARRATAPRPRSPARPPRCATSTSRACDVRERLELGEPLLDPRPARRPTRAPRARGPAPRAAPRPARARARPRPRAPPRARPRAPRCRARSAARGRGPPRRALAGRGERVPELRPVLQRLGDAALRLLQPARHRRPPRRGARESRSRRAPDSIAARAAASRSAAAAGQRDEHHPARAPPAPRRRPRGRRRPAAARRARRPPPAPAPASLAAARATQPSAADCVAISTTGKTACERADEALVGGRLARRRGSPASAASAARRRPAAPRRAGRPARAAPRARATRSGAAASGAPSWTRTRSNGPSRQLARRERARTATTGCGLDAAAPLEPARRPRRRRAPHAAPRSASARAEAPAVARGRAELEHAAAATSGSRKLCGRGARRGRPARGRRASGRCYLVAGGGRRPAPRRRGRRLRGRRRAGAARAPRGSRSGAGRRAGDGARRRGARGRGAVQRVERRPRAGAAPPRASPACDASVERAVRSEPSRALAERVLPPGRRGRAPRGSRPPRAALEVLPLRRREAGEELRAREVAERAREPLARSRRRCRRAPSGRGDRRAPGRAPRARRTAAPPAARAGRRRGAARTRARAADRPAPTRARPPGRGAPLHDERAVDEHERAGARVPLGEQHDRERGERRGSTSQARSLLDPPPRRVGPSAARRPPASATLRPRRIADVRQVPQPAVPVEPVADHELVRDLEAPVVDRDLHLRARRLLEQRADLQRRAGGASRGSRAGSAS